MVNLYETTTCCICDKIDLENIFEVFSLGSLWLKFLSKITCISGCNHYISSSFM